tara:strand:+ start:439 stop:747 length:309 start_codon:yes stop_codon:yes gene_type:complete
LKSFSKYDIVEAVKTIYDPDISINIFDLGLIYLIDIANDNKIKINMTLTSVNCPFAQELPEQVKNVVELIDGVGEVTVNLVWDPPWSPEHMTEAAKLELGFI